MELNRKNILLLLIEMTIWAKNILVVVFLKEE